MVDGNGANGNGRFVEEQPYRWSQRWFEDPPVGTVKLGHRPWEMHIGNGVWVEIDDVPG